MQYTHPLDRLVYRLRFPIVVGAVISAPVMLISYGMMMVDFVMAQPGWLGAIIFASHFTGWIGLSALFDSLKEKQQTRQADRS